MGESQEERIAQWQKKRIERAKNVYEKKTETYARIMDRRNEFLKANDERLRVLMAKNDLRIGEDEEKRARAARHRQLVEDRRKAHEKLVAKRYRETNIRERNRLRNIEMDQHGVRFAKRFREIVIAGATLFVVIAVAEVVLPGSKLKRERIIDDTPIEQIIPILPAKEYRDYIGVSEEQILWDQLMEHFDGNETAVLGVMCNLKAESDFEAFNLENYNNKIWEVSDGDYTEKVNRRTIDKRDFLEARNLDDTNGYYNKYDQWVNRDGGYGYGQYTAYEKKEQLYQFAEHWFGPGGPGEEYRFNIGDPDMQAHYLVFLLESEDYARIDRQLRSAKTVVDACYIWLKHYEVPYDPYNDDYYTLAFDRAVSAEEIRQNCGTKGEE